MNQPAALTDQTARRPEDVFPGAERFPPRGVKPQIWDRIQLRRLERDIKTLHQARLIGYIKDQSILVTMPMTDGNWILLSEGEPLEVRMLIGKNIYVFKTEVQRLCIAPTHYLHLNYPAAMGRQKLRQAPWAKVNLVGTATGASGASEPAYIVNLSAAGAQIHLPRHLGGDGDLMKLSMVVTVDELRAELSLDAEIRHVRPAAANEEMLEYGIAFRELRPEDALWLKCVVYQRIAEGYVS
jgi:hypothetical protein